MSGADAAGTSAEARAGEFLARIERRETVVGVVGLGYVGLPLALTFHERGFRVLGFDVDPAKIEALDAGHGYIKHLGSERVAAASASDRFSATTDFTRLGEPDAVLIAVPTPLTRQREPEMKYVVQTSEALARHLRPGQLAVLESTTYPGTTDELMRDILESGSGLSCERDFFLAYSPEREDPGNARFDTATIPKVVGGVGDDATRVAAALYAAAIDEVVPVTSARVAEATKLTENIFRAVNIALVNELKVIYDRMGIDVWEVLDAAATKPFGFMKFTPGPGLGGHCIPLDPFYLTWKAREYKTTTRFIELAGEVNVAMPTYVVEKVKDALNDRERALKNARVLLIGIAYKKDIDDPRESPSFELMELLLQAGARVDYHDPHIPRMPKMRSWPSLPVLESIDLTSDALGAYDVVLLATDHSAVDYDALLEHAPLIVDTRGIYRAVHPKVVKA
ncbi:MAG: nucleotide sugar dehydrogenase [Myxococcota bacterium]